MPYQERHHANISNKRPKLLQLHKPSQRHTRRRHSIHSNTLTNRPIICLQSDNNNNTRTTSNYFIMFHMNVILSLWEFLSISNDNNDNNGTWQSEKDALLKLHILHTYTALYMLITHSHTLIYTYILLYTSSYSFLMKKIINHYKWPITKLSFW